MAEPMTVPTTTKDQVSKPTSTTSDATTAGSNNAETTNNDQISPFPTYENVATNPVTDYYQAISDPATNKEQVASTVTANVDTTTNHDGKNDPTTDYELVDDVIPNPDDWVPPRGTCIDYNEEVPGNGFVTFFETESSKPDAPIEMRQKRSYLARIVPAAHTAILIVMVAMCGIAPLDVNPMIGPYPDTLSSWGAKNANLLLYDHEWWRLFTPFLLHAGVFHLICSVTLQFQMCALFEREWGSKNWLIIYLTSAVGSTIFSSIFQPDVLSVGGTGALMGLFGAKLAEIVFRCCESTTTLRGSMGHIARREQLRGVFFCIVLLSIFSVVPQIGWASNAGGLAAGFLIGAPIACWHMEIKFVRILFILSTFGFTVAAFLFALQYLYSGIIEPANELSDVCYDYQQSHKGYECKCPLPF